MTQPVFAVFDAKAEAYLAPFTASTFGLAERMFVDMVNLNDHQFNRHPEDYTLYVIGKFDSHTSALESSELRAIITGIQALRDSLDSIPIPLSSDN